MVYVHTTVQEPKAKGAAIKAWKKLLVSEQVQNFLPQRGFAPLPQALRQKATQIVDQVKVAEGVQPIELEFTKPQRQGGQQQNP